MIVGHYRKYDSPGISSRQRELLVTQSHQRIDRRAERQPQASPPRRSCGSELLARYGAPGHTHKALPKVSQEMLAEMVGTTRSRVNFFMNKFRKLGFIQYNGEIQVNDSLLSIVLHE